MRCKSKKCLFIMAVAMAVFFAGVWSSSPIYAETGELNSSPFQQIIGDPLDEEEGEIPAEEGEGVLCDDDPTITITITLPITRAILNLTATFERVSSTSAKAVVHAEASSTTKTMESTICLQKKNKSTGKFATVSGTTRTKKVSGHYITHAPTYSIQAGQTYRIKCEVYDGTAMAKKYQSLT